MKHFIFTLLACFIFVQLSGQSIPNNNFDNWYFGGIDRLWDWGNSEGCDIGGPHMTIYNVHGDFSRYNDPAVRLRTWKDNNDSIQSSYIYAGYQNLFNSTTGICEFELIKTGHPFPHRPAKMHGFYKFENDSLFTNDFGKGVVLLRKTNPITQMEDMVGFGTIHLPITNSDTVYQPFEIDINYLSADVPDTISIAFFSTGLGVSGGVLYVDSLTFSGFSPTHRLEENRLGVLLAPNPTTDFVDIIMDDQEDLKNSKVFIMDVAGKMVFQQDLKQSRTRIHLLHLPSAVYFVTVRTDKKSQTLKWIKQGF
jgi:hypothetical protein